MTGTVELTLTSDFAQQRREVMALEMVPTGAKVVIHIGAVTLFDSWVKEELRKHAGRLDLDAHGLPESLWRFVRMVRNGGGGQW